MPLSLEQCERILERLGYHLPSLGMFERPRPPGRERTYVSEGKIGGPKGIGFALQEGATIDSDAFRAWLLGLGFDAEAVAEVFDALA